MSLTSLKANENCAVDYVGGLFDKVMPDSSKHSNKVTAFDFNPPAEPSNHSRPVT